MQTPDSLKGIGFFNKIGQLATANKRTVYFWVSILAGYVMAACNIFNGISPFGVAFCAALPSPFAMTAAFGSVLGYVFAGGAGVNMKYIAAVVVVVALKWLFAGKFSNKYDTVTAALSAVIALGISGTAVVLTADPTLYDIMLLISEVFLNAGAAYFFTRSVKSLENGWGSMNRSDVSCLIVTFAVIIMGFSAITIGQLSIGRMVSVVVILICARVAGEAGGAVAGITAGIVMGISGGDYAYAIAAYGFGGLMAGVFGGLGRIATAGVFILINAGTALFTQGATGVYISLFEIFAASMVFSAIPAATISRIRTIRLGGVSGYDASAQAALRIRMEEVSDALREIAQTTREVSSRLNKLEAPGLSEIFDKVAANACEGCKKQSVCWQYKEVETVRAMKETANIMRAEGGLKLRQVPNYFTEHCCNIEALVNEFNAQFQWHLSRQAVRNKVAKVREVMTDQFDGMSVMLDDLSAEMCRAIMLEPAQNRKVWEYFEKEGITVEQLRCYKNEYDRIAVELSLPKYQLPRLKVEKAAVDLSTLLEGDFDLPAVSIYSKNAVASFFEKADYTVEVGTYQILPEGQKLCGDSFESIINYRSKAHFILSDGMGSGRNAAVDSHMATALFKKLIAVGFTHESALKMVNSALLIKSGEESLATVDICTLDLYTGHASFYKAGAAQSFVLRNGKAGHIESTSLPAGILQGVGFEKSEVTLHESDVIVMLSDGATATGIEWIKSEMESEKTNDMQRLAEKIAMTAKIRRVDQREDDITVLAIALKKGI